ncbi:kinase-like protein, partial [Wolfiporia cocos MD-104 SS10]
FFAEAVVWRHLIHPNIARFYGAYEPNQRPMVLVSEWLPKGDIMRNLENEPMADRIKLILGIAHGLEYLHANQVVHGDLKSQNIMINQHGSPCLIDFGLATVIHNTATVNIMTTTQGKKYTACFSAPEILNAVIDPTKASDIYALAMVIWTVFSNKMPFSGMLEAAVINRVVYMKDRPDRPENTIQLGLSDKLWEWIKTGWSQGPTERPPVSSLINLLTGPPGLHRVRSRCGWHDHAVRFVRIFSV